MSLLQTLALHASAKCCDHHSSKEVELSALLPSYCKFSAHRLALSRPDPTYNYIDPMSLALSPSRRMAVACALNDGRIPCHIGYPVIFKLGPSHNSTASHDSNAQDSLDKSQSALDALAASLVNSLIARRSVRDVLLSAARWDAGTSLSALVDLPPRAHRTLYIDSKRRLLRMSWNVASDVLQSGKVEQTRLIWPLLAIQRRLQM